MKTKIFTIIVLALVALVSCKAPKPLVVEVPIQYKERIVERLVPVQLPADSSAISALFECDSIGKVIMKELSEEKSKRIESLFSFDSGQLKYKVKTVHDTVYIAAKDSMVYKEIPIRVEVPVEVNRITWWQKLQMNAGRLFAFILLLYIVYTVLKWRSQVLK